MTSEANSSEYPKPRRATRYYFGGIVELTDRESGQMTVALVRALSLYGCFVKTDHSFSLGTKLVLKMMHAGFHFVVNGTVVNLTEIGIGVEFTEIDSIDRLRLAECLAELERAENSASPSGSRPSQRSGFRDALRNNCQPLVSAWPDLNYI